MRVVFILMLFSYAVQAAVTPDKPPFALTIEQARDWQPDSALASEQNRSAEPLAARRFAPVPDTNARKMTPARVLFAPDGMNNFANYLEPQSAFNLYNFTQWSQIDVLNWFAGTADLNIQIPARPWVDIAHKNGVKVIGSVFLGIAKWGGSADTAEKLLEQDAEGNFIIADQLIAIARYYGFDGWLINQETDLTAVKDSNNELIEGAQDAERGRQLAAKMKAFVRYLTHHAPAGMEIHWYDAMVESGEVRWQNMLNDTNAMFLKEDGRVSDAMFINYWWDREMVLASRDKAVALGRSPYDVFMGADLWPHRNAQRAFSETSWLTALEQHEQPVTSLALFAPNFNYNFSGNAHTAAMGNFISNPDNVNAFYAAQHRLFSGDNKNLATRDTEGFVGVGAIYPAKSAIRLPLKTSFNTGHGKAWFEAGSKVDGEWTDMGRQDALPTWQFAIQGQHQLDVRFDFTKAFNGGSSLLVSGDAEQARIPLFALSGQLQPDANVTITYQSSAPVTVYLARDDGTEQQIVLPVSEAWSQYSAPVMLKPGQTFTHAGLQASDVSELSLRLGEWEIGS
ncbi:endo-beta-N-acetylglucosaminidase [Alteromonas halophila]|uniref:Cytosolic endo-beta-N-acetylglucosaminidase TIM barrel domain-containing protein n=1 Tax=Alteromonas halophila TaxID=516698 RepID=A0A918JJW6_9ALTE|nr:endo-beta-N-acetylglucosaminidase [Alteromonas halophila]GGW84794.1 hypothetical protein GCM10007391_18200 [Alteromonas halophila]